MNNTTTHYIMSTTTKLDVRAALESLKPLERPLFRLEMNNEHKKNWSKYPVTSADGNDIFKRLMARFRAGNMDPRLKNGHGWLFRLVPMAGASHYDRKDITWESVQELLSKGSSAA
jgi:hypothetical protein